MMSRIDFGGEVDLGMLPPAGTRHALLMWVQAVESEEEQTNFVGIVLDGPGDWAREVEFYEPTFMGLPPTLPTGVYVIEMEIDYRLNEFGDEDDVTLTFLRHARVLVPGREDLKNFTFGRTEISA
jgi:hypothetical protein